jgi:hypothetical protein
LQFRIEDGPQKGAITRPYGGRWDRAAQQGAGQWVSWWDPTRGWIGDDPPRDIYAVAISAQSWPFIWDWDHRVILVEGGRRSGKSYALACKAAIAALCFAHRKGIVLSPTYRQAWNVWNHLRRVIPRHWLLPGRRGVNRTDRVLRLWNGSEIGLLHAYHDDASRSQGIAWGAPDERQEISEEAFGNFFLSASEGGSQYILFETATIKEELREHHDAVIASSKGAVYRMSSYGNPFIDHSLFEDAKEFLDERMIEREIDARWPELIGRIYYPFRSSPGEHVRDHPLQRGRTLVADKTAAFCAERFDTPVWGDGRAVNIIGVDPPHHAVILRALEGNVLHAIDEVIVGLDGLKGDVRDLAQRCADLYPGGVVIRDPHEQKHGEDCDRYFRAQGYRVAHLGTINPEYRFTAVRSRFEKGKMFVSPRCRHLIECLERQTYKESKPDKTITSKITPHMTVDHSGDALGYAVYKLWPAKYDYAKNEEEKTA